MTLRNLLAQAESALAPGPHSDRARLDAESLLLHLLGQSRAWLLGHITDPAPPELATAFHSLIARRLRGEPIQYITGSAEFYGLALRVTPAVLIPRPETEHLVEEALRIAQNLPHPRILDIGSGSGAIAIALAHHLPHAQVTSIDISPEALAIARDNAAIHHLDSRIHFLLGDLFAPIDHQRPVSDQRFDLILSNPPYIPLTDRPSLAVEVRDHEPPLALFAGPDGLDLYRRLIPAARQHLTPGGSLLLEIGYGQQPAMQSLLTQAGFSSIHFLPDYQGIPRVACALFH